MDVNVINRSLSTSFPVLESYGWRATKFYENLKNQGGKGTVKKYTRARGHIVLTLAVVATESPTISLES